MKKITKLILAFTLVVSGLYAGSMYNVVSSNIELKACSTIAECNEQQDALAAQKKEKQSELDGYEAQETEYMSQLKIIAEQVNLIEEEIELTEQTIDLKEKEIEQKEKDVEQNENEVLKRIKDQQLQQNENVMLHMLISTSSVTDFMKRWNLMETINNEAATVVQDLMDKIAEIEAEKAELEAQKESLDTQRVELNEKKKETEDLKRKLKIAMEEAREQMDAIETSQSEIDAQKAILSRPKPSPSGGGGSLGGYSGDWTPPTNPADSVITTRFLSPTYLYMFGWTHTGTDIGAYHGAPIYSIGPGTVIKTGFDGTFGNHVVVYHEAKDTISVYAHMSGLHVSAGQYVNGGTQIGNMGNTGLSFGTHLHLEIIANTNYFSYGPKSFREDNGLDLVHLIGPVYSEWSDAY